MSEAQQPAVQLLTGEELLSLHAATKFDQLGQQQRYNLIVFGVRTGLRPSTIGMLKCNMLRIRHDDDGPLQFACNAPPYASRMHLVF